MGSHSIHLHTADPVCQVNQHNIEVMLVQEHIAEEQSKEGLAWLGSTDCDGAIVDKPGADCKQEGRGHHKHP